jgi:glyoxylase-like metal-dependent hydrolase (beta-lactamase superfamily II)
MKRFSILALTIVVGIVVAILGPSSNWVKKAIFAQAMPQGYFAEFDRIQPSLYQVSGNVYAFEKGFARSMVLRTAEGIAIFDTFDTPHMLALKGAVEEAFPGEPVRWLILSHNHLDHIRGSDVFPNVEVLGHADINQLVADWPNVNGDVAPVSRPITGDQTLTIGATTIEALYMPFSHSSTMYGFYVPSESVVFAPDMMFVNAVPPFGFPDFYYPGYIRALDRLIALNADHYVPSHMDRGTLKDLVAYREMTVDFQRVVEDEYRKIDVEEFIRGEGMRTAIKSAYDRLEPRYGDLHGFDDMFVPKFGRHLGGTYLGY